MLARRMQVALGRAPRPAYCRKRAIHNRRHSLNAATFGAPVSHHQQKQQLQNQPSEEGALPAQGPLPADAVRKVFTLAVAAVSLAAPPAARAAASAATGDSSLLTTLVGFLLHLDTHLSGLIAAHGPATYLLLWAIVFCETGLVLTPFLPGDSLLFAAGAFAGMGQLSLPLLFWVFVSAAVIGDAVNYAIGNKLGRWALGRRLLDPGHVAQTEAFYDKYGAKTVVLARFVPIVRTFAPFVAGIGSMTYSKFALYNVVGALLWTVLFLAAGFFFGNLPVVQHNFTLVVLAIVAVSLLPVLLELAAARRERHQQQGGEGGGAAAT